MTETEFYALIDAARVDAGPLAPSADPDALREVLASLPDEQVAAFGVEFRRQLVRLNDWAVWDAGYAASGGLSDDAFHYFRSWLIGKGARAVQLALESPDELVPFLDTDELENELLEYVVDEVLEERGVDLDEDDDDDDDEDLRGLVDGEPAGEPFDEETSDDRHPGLAAWWNRVSGGVHPSDPAEEFDL
ncbi:DUF4240 domain-containing protein [Agromyces sp. MMS24-JH15]|uniref:DUF4240 domain-containing protein n=1 Tax=Agromyces sp. MMS24-JH15 TaxID=3243765 RepID=UPI003749669D